MLKIKIYWHSLSDCLKYWREAINQGATFRIADITESFNMNKFYSKVMVFNDVIHFNNFCFAHKIKYYEYLEV